jgi:hypothetical protein
VASAHTAELQGLIDRLGLGDDSARGELINRAYPRLRALAARLLGDDFPALRGGPAFQSTSDIANEVGYRLYEALKEVRPPTVRDFLRLAAARAKWNLIARPARRPPGTTRPSPPPTTALSVAASQCRTMDTRACPGTSLVVPPPPATASGPTRIDIKPVNRSGTSGHRKERLVQWGGEGRFVGGVPGLAPHTPLAQGSASPAA